MNNWTEGIRIFAEQLGIIQGSAVCADKRGVKHHVDIKNGYLYHYICSSRPIMQGGVLTWIFTDPTQISNTKFVGQPNIRINEDGDLEIWAPKSTGGKKRLWAKPESFPDPAEPNPP